MKTILTFFSLLILAGFVSAQGPLNAAVSSIQVYDMGNGSGIVEVKVNGNGAAMIESCPIVISGQPVGGTAYLVANPLNRVNTNPSESTVLLVGGFALTAPEDDGPRFVDVDVQVPVYRAGPGLGTRFSCPSHVMCTVLKK